MASVRSEIANDLIGKPSHESGPPADPNPECELTLKSRRPPFGTVFADWETSDAEGGRGAPIGSALRSPKDCDLIEVRTNSRPGARRRAKPSTTRSGR